MRRWMKAGFVGICMVMQILVLEDARSHQGAEVAEFYGYHDCIRLSNSNTEVILCPAAGGRVLKYALDGVDALYLPAGNEGWRWDGKASRAPMDAGRFDIGPEKVVPSRPLLWQGAWAAKIVGDRHAILTSQKDASTGVQITREFMLSAADSTLSCKQTVHNVSDAPVEYCHWSRTFAMGKGVCVIPTSKFSKYPNHYVRYDSGDTINLRPEDEHVVRQGDYLVISDAPRNPKLGFDSREGWLAYASPQNLLFVKRFPVFPNRAYNEVAGLTISVWYPNNSMVELEPIGPQEHIEPGQAASFVETWNLLPFDSSSLPKVEPIEIDRAVKTLPPIAS